jgi:hypothetical protein
MAPKRTFVDADTQTDVLCLVHSETQTTPLLATVVDIQTAPTTPPLIDRMTETGHQNLIDIIEREWEAQLDRRDFYLYHGDKAAANEITNVDLPRLDDLYQWLLKDKEKAKKHKWREKTVRVFTETYEV